jgi:5-methylcytosine-specific restriction endonuclease McrA
MPPARNGRNLRSYRRQAQRVALSGAPCWLCGLPIDPGLHYLDPMAGTADHITPLSQGGRIHGDLRPAHRSCNSRRNDLRHGDQFDDTHHDLDW